MLNTNVLNMIKYAYDLLSVISDSGIKVSNHIKKRCLLQHNHEGHMKCRIQLEENMKCRCTWLSLDCNYQPEPDICHLMQKKKGIKLWLKILLQVYRSHQRSLWSACVVHWTQTRHSKQMNEISNKQIVWIQSIPDFRNFNSFESQIVNAISFCQRWIRESRIQTIKYENAEKRE